MEDHEERKDVQLKVMITASQKRRWEKASRLARRSLSDWIRVNLDDICEVEESSDVEKMRDSKSEKKK